MKRVVTLIAVLVALAAFPGPGVAGQKGQGMQQQKSQAAVPAKPRAVVTQPTPNAVGRAKDACAACRKWCKSRCVEDPDGTGSTDCMCIRSEPNYRFVPPEQTGGAPPPNHQFDFEGFRLLPFPFRFWAGVGAVCPFLIVSGTLSICSPLEQCSHLGCGVGF